jgi:hypothetical protein
METIWEGDGALLRSALQVLGATWCAIERTPSGAILLTARTEHYTASIALSGDALIDALPAQFMHGWYAGRSGRSVYHWAELYREMLRQDADTELITVDGITYPRWMISQWPAAPVTIDGRTLPRVALAVAYELARVRSVPYVTFGHVVQAGAPTRLYLVDKRMIVQCDAVAGEA